MRQVAVINDVPIYSDKPGAIGINNDRVTFQDGSSCNVRTREVDNRGPGTIRIGDGAGSAGVRADAPRTSSTKSFPTADRLRAEGAPANIKVEVDGGSDTMSVTVSGPKPSVDAVSVRVDGRTLVVGKAGGSTGHRGGAHARGSVTVRGSVVGAVVVGSGGSISVSSGGDDVDVDVVVKVPRGTPVEVDDVLGRVDVGDTEGEVSVSVSGGGDAHVGRVREASISVLGGSDVYVSEVVGPISAKIMGSGDDESGEWLDLANEMRGRGAP